MRTLATALVCLSACSNANINDPIPGEADSGPGVPDPGDPTRPPEECASAKVEVSEVTPTVMLLVDRSGTMDFSFTNQTRWQAVYSTLMGTSGVVRQLQDKARFGLSLYSAADGNPTCPILKTVAPAMSNFDAINSTYTAHSPLEDTPTGASLTAMIPILEAVTEPGPKIVVLATDGEPDTCAVKDPDGRPEARQESIAAAQAAQTAGIDTYVISVGDAVAQAHLQDMANAGVGLPIGGTQAAPFFRALSPQELINAFNAIVSGVRSCNFALDRTIAPADVPTGTVTLDGAPLQHGTDWEVLEDGQTLELRGAACEQLMAGGNHVVEAEFECGGDGDGGDGPIG